MSLHAYTTMVVCAILANLYVLKIIKSKWISETAGILWMIFTLGISIIILVPNGVDILGLITGVKYPPIVLIGIMIIFITWFVLRLSSQVYLLKKDRNSLVHRIAILEKHLEEVSRSDELK